MTCAIIYLAGIVLVWAAVLVSLRSEPTAHGQIIGRQFGCLLAVLWPAALVYFTIALPIALPLMLIHWWGGEYK